MKQLLTDEFISQYEGKEVMQVEKRDGRIVKFDKEKIYIAIIKAFEDIDGEVSDESKSLAENIANSIERVKRVNMHVEEIQDLIETKLMASKRKDVAKQYILYRDKRTRVRDSSSKLIRKVKERIDATNIENSNANVDERSFSGREKEASADLQKFMAIELGGLSEPVAKAHKEMLVYQHDLDKALLGQHNCLNLNFQEIFKNGFTTRNGDVRPPNSFSTACQLVAVAFQCQSQVQFGGVGTIHLDYDLAPFVHKSFLKHFKDGLKYVDNVQPKEISIIMNMSDLGIDNKYIQENYPESYKYAMDMLEKEGSQSAQGLYHNLNTLESRQGSQVPFTSINLGRDTSTEGRLVTKWMMNASIDGIGKHHLTSIFPYILGA
jgi:ribonucleoside-triphosphate reductase